MNIEKFVVENYTVSTDDKLICDAAQKLINEAGSILSDVTELSDNTLRLTYKETSEVVIFTAVQGFALLDKGVLSSPHFKKGGVSKNFKEKGYTKVANAVKKAIKPVQEVVTAASILVADVTSTVTDYIKHLNDSLTAFIASDDLVTSNLKLVEDGKPVTFSGLIVDTSKTAKKLDDIKREEEERKAREEFAATIKQIESIFDSFNMFPSVKPKGIYLLANLGEDEYYPEHKEALVNALKASGFNVKKLVEDPDYNMAKFTIEPIGK